MCLYPRLIKNRKYTETKKNNGIIPVADDARVLLVPVGCGKCIECSKQKARQWQVRLAEEIRTDKTGKFVTLTFSNESIKELYKKTEGDGYERDNNIATYAVRKFLERWRKKHKKSVKHWLITELGGKGTENIHIHGIIWTNKENEEISERWGYGSITIGKRVYVNGKAINNNSTGYVNDETITYISKYITKKDAKHKEYNGKILTSAGIGSKYVERPDAKNNKYNGENTREEYVTRTGQKLSMPIYFRNKIYTEEEREKLWLMKLDKEERWVLGQKIDISKEEKWKKQD